MQNNPIKLEWGFSSSMCTEESSSADISSSPRFVAVNEKQKFVVDFWHQRSEYTQSCVKILLCGAHESLVLSTSR